MKVLLVQPPFTIFRNEAKKCHPPLGLAYIAASLKGRHEVFVLDALAEGYDEQEFVGKEFLKYGLSINTIKKRIEYIKPDAVGVSCLFSAQSGNVHKICEAVKEINNEIITILGGGHPSAVPEEVLKDSNIDFVVLGEGEDVFSNLLECMEKRGGIKQCADIDGIGFRYKDTLQIRHRKHYQKNLDDIPFPDWDKFPLERYFSINNPHGGLAKSSRFLPIITSRGCPFECIFCSVHNLWGRGYRRRSADNVLKELNWLKNKFGIKEIMFEDDNIAFDRVRAEEIFQGMIDKGLNIIWSVPNGIAVQTLDDRLLEIMAKSGCYQISLGIESGDEYILTQVIKKPIRLAMVKPVIRKAKLLGIDVVAFFVVGFPGESRKQLENTFNFAEGLEADSINFFFATPLPGTQLLQICREKNLLEDNFDYLRLKSDCPTFATESYSTYKLKLIVSQEKIKLYFLYLLRNPGKFLSKLWRKLKRCLDIRISSVYPV